MSRDRGGALVGAMLGGAFGLGLLLWAFMAAGFGHGSYLPAALIGAPISALFTFGALAAPAWWATIGYAIGRRAIGSALALFALHALGVAVCLARGTPWESSDEQWRYLATAGQRNPLIWPGFAFYLAGIVVTLALALRQLFDERQRRPM